MNLKLPVQQIQVLCALYPIAKLSVFGSVLRDDFTETSDIDLLVEYLPNAKITLLDMASQEIELSNLIGRRVDLRTPNELSPHFRDEVLNHAKVIYERSG